MTILLSQRKAFGHPGISPRRTRSAKDVVGAADADSSRVWFTVARGILNEVYFPTVDRPAHAEYIKLLRSASDGEVSDHIPALVARYQERKPLAQTRYAMWKFTRRPRTIQPGCTLRVVAGTAFTLHWTANEWRDVSDSSSVATSVGVDFVDLPVPVDQTAPRRFTFFWTERGRWEGKDFSVAIDSAST